MTEHDKITEERLDAVALALRRAYLGRLAASFIGGAVFCVLGLLIVYFLPASYDRTTIVPLLVLASAVIAACLAFEDWRVHRSERIRIAEFRGRLRAGEILTMQDVMASKTAA